MAWAQTIKVNLHALDTQQKIDKTYKHAMNTSIAVCQNTQHKTASAHKGLRM